jgi:oligopeptide/dipeptide ABC transporter ATP-binding protein
VRGLFYRPRHPYTKALLDSIPKLGVKTPLYGIPGQPPDLSQLPSGCSFHPRCRQVVDRCRIQEPGQYDFDGDGNVRCWLAGQEVAASG